MPERIRKLIGTAVLLVFVLVYALLAMSVGGAVAAGLPEYLRFVFYLVAGLVWVLPAMLIIRWMQRPSP